MLCPVYVSFAFLHFLPCTSRLILFSEPHRLSPQSVRVQSPVSKPRHKSQPEITHNPNLGERTQKTKNSSYSTHNTTKISDWLISQNQGFSLSR